MRVRILTEAEIETHESSRWYEERQPSLGIAFLDALAEALQAIEAHPDGMRKSKCAPPLAKYDASCYSDSHTS